MYLIRKFFETKKEEQLAFAYSLKEVVESSDEFKEFYNNVEIGFVVSLQTIRQFEKDMMNCNRQPHPWLAYNYYMTPLKRTDEYMNFINFVLILLICEAGGKCNVCLIYCSHRINSSSW